MNIAINMNFDGAIRINDIVDNHRVYRVYYGCSEKEAIRRFKLTMRLIK